jgi:hypothetical protein
VVQAESNILAPVPALDEKTFYAIPKRHQQNDGLYISRIDPTRDELDQLDIVQDQYSSTVYFWGGISYYGKAKAVVFTRSMDQTFYQNSILKASAFRCIRLYPQLKRLQQDNNPSHTAHSTVKVLDDNLGKTGWTRPPPLPCKLHNKHGQEIKTKKAGHKRTTTCPSIHCHCKVPKHYVHMAKSPDAAIMEHAFTWMVNKSKAYPVPKSSEALQKLLLKLWDDLPMSYIRDLVDSMPDRFRAIVKANGKMSKY